MNSGASISGWTSIPSKIRGKSPTSNRSVANSDLFLYRHGCRLVGDDMGSVRCYAGVVLGDIRILRDLDRLVHGDGLVPNLHVVAIRCLASTTGKKSCSKNREPESDVSNSSHGFFLEKQRLQNAFRERFSKENEALLGFFPKNPSSDRFRGKRGDSLRFFPCPTASNEPLRISLGIVAEHGTGVDRVSKMLAEPLVL